MKINRRLSNPKITSEKNMNITVMGKMYENKQPKLPPLQSTFRKTSHKFIKKEEIKEEITHQNHSTEATLTQSSMFQSYYANKTWVKPSDYIKDIKQLNLFNEQQDSDISKYQIKLNETNSKNLQKITSLFNLVQKWVAIIKKALFYVTSQKKSSNKLSQQILFWKVLSKKFDELEYQFSDKKTTEIVNLMTKIVKTNPDYKKIFEQFLQVREKAINFTHPIKRLYLCLQESVSGPIRKLEESSDIEQSLILLKNILLSFKMISQQQIVIKSRIQIIYQKIDLCSIQKLLSAPLYPHQLANISSLKYKYILIDRSLSFYSQFISVIEQQNNQVLTQIVERANYTQQVLVNLLQILSFFQYLYNKKDIYQFSNLSTNNIKYNIYQIENKHQWKSYMDLVIKSMEIRKFQLQE